VLRFHLLLALVRRSDEDVRLGSNQTVMKISEKCIMLPMMQLDEPECDAF
jgi:hypothetical protein